MIKCTTYVLLLGTYNDAYDTPATRVRKEMFAKSANVDLEHLGVLLLSTTQQFSPRIFTVSMQRILDSYSLVEVTSLAKSSSVGVIMSNINVSTMHDSLLHHSRKMLLRVSIHSHKLLSCMYSWFDSLIHEHSQYLKNTIASQKSYWKSKIPQKN